MPAANDSTHHKLRERIKELTALHATARLLQDDARSARDVVRDVRRCCRRHGNIPTWPRPAFAAANR